MSDLTKPALRQWCRRANITHIRQIHPPGNLITTATWLRKLPTGAHISVYAHHIHVYDDDQLIMVGNPRQQWVHDIQLSGGRTATVDSLIEPDDPHFVATGQPGGYREQPH